MNSSKLLFTIITTLCLVAQPTKAFEVISAEDINTSGDGSHAEIDLTQNAETEFLSRLIADIETEDFELYGWATPANLSLTFPGAGTATLQGNGQVYSIEHIEGVTDQNIINQELNAGRYASSGVNYWQTSAEMGGSSTFTIELTEDIAAFGFYAYDLGDFGGDLALKLYRDNQLVATISNTNYNFYTVATGGSTSGSALYIGIVGELQADGTYETFDRVEFVINNDTGSYRDDFAFDDMTIATSQQLVSVFPD